jgi:hypothetical protein
LLRACVNADAATLLTALLDFELLKSFEAFEATLDDVYSCLAMGIPFNWLSISTLKSSEQLQLAQSSSLNPNWKRL